MSVRKKARLTAFSECLNVVAAARLDRPEKPRGSSRRRCGDVIRWKMNNDTLDQVKEDILDLMRREVADEVGKPVR